MFSMLLDFLLRKPRRLITLGKVLYRTGSFLVVAGLIGRGASVGLTAIRSLGGRQGVELSLANIYPTLPTWWVPESLLGYALGMALMLLGVAVTMTGRRWKRLLA